MLDDESDNDMYDFGYAGTYSFTDFSLCFDNSVGHVSGLGCGFFVPTGVESKCDIFAFVLFVPIQSNTKVFDSSKILALKFLALFPNLKLSFIFIVMV